VLFMTGGGATNVAVNAVKQGLKVACVASIGEDDAGNSIVDRLHRDGVDTSLFFKIPNLGTAYSVILTSFEGDRTVLVFRGAGEAMTYPLLQPSLDKLFDTKWVFIGNLGKASDEVFPPLFEEAKRRGVRIGFNPGVSTIKKGLEANKELLNGVSVLLLNREETLMLHGKPEDIRHDWIREELLYKELLLSLRSAGVKIPVITDGFRGAHALEGDDYLFCPTFTVKVVSTLGAGDAFGSTFVAAIERHGDVRKALLEATANSANVIQGFGAKKRLLSVEEIEKFITEYNTPDQKHPVKVVRKPISTLGSPGQSH